MLIRGERTQFTDENLAHVPKCSGVYVLYNGFRIIYIGKAIGSRNLREQLQAHKRGEGNPYTRHATHYCYEMSPSAANREKDIMWEYKKVYGCLPACNAAMANRYSF
jgi:excinuclease UvrABC nuclease subunit